MFKSVRAKRSVSLGLLATGLASALLALCALAANDNEWTQWRGSARDGVWKETGLISKFAGPQVEVRWRHRISNGYSGPTVADGRVYVTDRVTDPRQQERVHCFEWETGRILWTYAYDAIYAGIGYQNGPRAAVTINDGRAYALGAMGHLHCLDAADGSVIWSKDLNREYRIRMPNWGIAAAPLIEGDLVILHIGGEGDACFVAFDKKTGQERWRALRDRPSYVAPIIIEQAGERVMVCWTGDRVVALDPKNGKLHWSYPFAALKTVVAIATPVFEKDRLFFSSFYDGSLMLKLRQDRLAAEKVWQRRGQNEIITDALHTMFSTPLMINGYVYGVDSYGELRCLNGNNGDRIWESLKAVPKDRWANIHLVRNADKVWMFNERGELIISRLTPKGFEEISRAQLIEPTTGQLGRRGQGVCWSHPAFAYKHVFARNDKELVCATLAAK